MGDVGERVLDVVDIVEDLGAEVRLDEDVACARDASVPRDRRKRADLGRTRREEPDEREKVGREGGGENVEADGTATGRIVLVGRVVLADVVNVPSPVAPTDDDDRSVLYERYRQLFKVTR